MRRKLETPMGNFPMFMNHSMAEGGFLPVHDKVPHALWFFLRESHRILVETTRKVIYEIDGVREGKTEEQILHELFLRPAKATADLYGVTLDQMFSMPNVRLCISEVQRCTLRDGTFMTDGLDPRILGWIQSGGKENFVPRVASYWFSESGS